MLNELKEQFNLRAEGFDISANWVSCRKLIKAHTELAGGPYGEALDLCCGTGRVGYALKKAGWKVRGLDISKDMLRTSLGYFPALLGKAEEIPFKAGCFHLVACRQTFQFLKAKEALSEIARVLAPGGIFILSLTVPFCGLDEEWLYKIHRVKQPLLLNFYSAGDLKEELKASGFLIKETRIIKVRENINRWMDYAPELSRQVRNKVILMVKNAPYDYKKLHSVDVINGEVFEDWNWVVLKTCFSKK